MSMRRLLALILIGGAIMSGTHARAQTNDTPARFRLITLDPGHFTAALVQKFMYPDVDPVVHVYAPSGDDLAQHLKRIERFNTRADQPTHWQEKVYTGPDFLEKMLKEKPGNIVVLAGNNTNKTEYILRSVQAGLNVLADKPMVITPDEFPRLQQAFALAASNHVLLYDIMTERFEITTALQRELSQQAALFGKLAQGSPTDPAITEESVHHFFKTVAGTPLTRPTWYFDVRQQGEGIVDVTTHLVDLIQWGAFPEQALSPDDVSVLSARRWATPITREQFKQVTGVEDFPDFLKTDMKDGVLQVYANGEFTYRLRGVCAKVTVKWNFEAPTGAGDMHASLMRGTKANLIIRQGADQKFKPVLYVENVGSSDGAALEKALEISMGNLQSKYPGVGYRRDGNRWQVTVPEKYDVGHEAHFAQVTDNYLRYLRAGRLPDWEVPNMITRYATIMKAYELSR
ncbi:MAG TPA: putative oxidoreductase C-terminal domain-containing protein [Verrucomicrobiae bacterium]|nr:putative oxidoreductase C-terminal domain-containing protein [Verrucomicrobiae bacterium]